MTELQHIKHFTGGPVTISVEGIPDKVFDQPTKVAPCGVQYISIITHDIRPFPPRRGASRKRYRHALRQWNRKQAPLRRADYEAFLERIRAIAGSNECSIPRMTTSDVDSLGDVSNWVLRNENLPHD